MKHNAKLALCLAALILLASLLLGCGASSAGDGTQLYPGGSNSSAGGMEEKPVEDGTVEGGSLIGEFERKIIRTVNMTCESKAYDDAVSMILAALKTHGGYVEASSSSGTAKTASSTETYRQARQATYTLRIPAENLDAFLNALRVDDGIRILSQNMSSNEITSSYYDTQTRLETLTAEKNALTAMLESFTDYTDIADMLAVQERLYNVIEEMEALQTQLNLYDSQVALSTVNLSLYEVVEYTEVEEPTFGQRISEAFTDSWTAFGEGCQDFAVWFVEALPTLLVLTVIVGVQLVVLFCILRACRKRRNKNRENR